MERMGQRNLHRIYVVDEGRRPVAVRTWKGAGAVPGGARGPAAAAVARLRFSLGRKDAVLLPLGVGLPVVSVELVVQPAFLGSTAAAQSSLLVIYPSPAAPPPHPLSRRAGDYADGRPPPLRGESEVRRRPGVAHVDCEPGGAGCGGGGGGAQERRPRRWRWWRHDDAAAGAAAGCRWGLGEARVSDGWGRSGTPLVRQGWKVESPSHQL